MANIWGLIKSFITDSIYSLLIGLILIPPLWMLNILKYLKNISVHIYWLLITGIMQLSLIIVFSGMLLTTLLIHLGLTIKSKILTGMRKIMVWLQKIVTKCFIKWKKRND